MALSTIPFSGLGADASNQGVNFRNLIINGDMSIAQRGTTAGNLANSNTGYYSVDRFAWAENGDDATIRQSFNQTTDVPTGQGFSKSLKVTTTTASGSPVANDYHRILHKIEAQNLQQLKFGTSNAEALTLSFWVKCSKTGNGVIFIYQDDSNQGVGGLTYTINSADTWEKKTISIPANTTNGITNDNGNGLQLEFIFNAGSNFTGGSPTGNWETFSNSIRAVGQTFTINDTLNAYYATTGVQLEVGTSASDFEFLPYDVNLQRCQRYYEKSYDVNTVPSTNTSNGIIIHSGSSNQVGNIQIPLIWKTPKRTSPSITSYTEAGTSGQWGYGRDGANGDAGTGTGATGENSTRIFLNIGSNWAVGNASGHYVADAEL